MKINKIILGLCVLCASAFAAPTDFLIFNNKRLIDSSADTTAAYDMNGTTGYVSVYCTKTQVGKVRMHYLLSIDGENFVHPTGGVNIFDSLKTTSGKASNGKDIVSFSPAKAHQIKFIATELTPDSSRITCRAYIP